jgi:serine/threonine protein kinase
MSIVSSGNLVDALRDSGLLAREQLHEAVRLANTSAKDARSLARNLVQRGWLTVYQINRILAGRGKELVIGPYFVLDRLGEGGLSSVYRAKHSVHDWHVALKLIQPDVIANAEGRRQFLGEVEAMARLEHPNIVQFCDADQVGDTFYYAMEYVEGTDLGKYVRLTGQLPVGEACDYIRQAALGLQHAHERNFVHRDIKPVNLYLTHQVRLPVAATGVSGYYRPIADTPSKPMPLIKILDWGLASLRSPIGVCGSDLVEHLAKGVIGTADYLSPEQARNAATVDIRGDIYSLGCTFYYLLTSQVPFPGKSLMQKVMQHQMAEPEAIATFREDVPSEVVMIVKRMMAKEPARRFQTPAGVALALLPFTRDMVFLQAPRTVPRIATSESVSRPSITDPTPLPASLRSTTETSRGAKNPDSLNDTLRGR